jgi:hypothetical protein
MLSEDKLRKVLLGAFFLYRVCSQFFEAMTLFREARSFKEERKKGTFLSSIHNVAFVTGKKVFSIFEGYIRSCDDLHLPF